jgi:SAM-dependent methyltransferase
VTDTPEHGDGFEANRSLWDVWTRIHAAGEFYDLAGFKAGGVRLSPYEIEAVGDVTGRSLLHLQCHFGIDTLSWARLGARVTGADISPAAIALAGELALELGFPDARFVESNVYDLTAVLHHEFDIVYTSKGAINWLPDIRTWARVVAHFVRPGGIFYMVEAHPVYNVFEDEGVAVGELIVRYPYFEHSEPIAFKVQGSYADPTADVGEQWAHVWDHGLGEIVTALIDAGLRIDALHEHPFLEWPSDFLVEADDGTWRLPPEITGELPLMFSLLASKPVAGDGVPQG